MSAKMRLTAWFTLMILLLSAMVITFVFVFNGNAVVDDPAGRLVKMVEKNARRFEFEHGRLEWDNINFYSRGVYTSVYDSHGNILKGVYPATMEEMLPFQGEIIRTVTAEDGEEYYVYDAFVNMDVTTLWFRGYISTQDGSGLMHTILVLTFTLLPAILLLSIVGGWFIAVGTFHPMERIIAAASSISDGHDLSARINLKHAPSEMKHLGKAFDRMFSRLEKSFNAEKQFASDVSHELRTPVAVILAQCERARRKDQTREDFLASLDVIEKQGHNMTDLIEQLLSLTRLEQGVDRYPLKEDNLSALVEAVSEEFVPRDARGIKYKSYIEEDIYASINPLLMSRIVQNLLTNAYKYGKENGHIQLSLRRDGSYAVLKVKDDGIGISREDQEKIWQRFWQADASRGEDGGSGLGLSMVKEMTEFHGGNVSVDSIVGAGSTFKIRIPLAKSEIDKLPDAPEYKDEKKKLTSEEKRARRNKRLEQTLREDIEKHEKTEQKKKSKKENKRRKKTEQETIQAMKKADIEPEKIKEKQEKAVRKAELRAETAGLSKAERKAKKKALKLEAKQAQKQQKQKPKKKKDGNNNTGLDETSESGFINHQDTDEMTNETYSDMSFGSSERNDKNQ